MTMKLAKIELIPRDTTLEAYRFQIEVLRKLGAEGRARAMFEISDNLRQTVESGVHLKYPSYNKAEILLTVIRLMAGDEIFKRLLPGVDLKR